MADSPKPSSSLLRFSPKALKEFGEPRTSTAAALASRGDALSQLKNSASVKAEGSGSGSGSGSSSSSSSSDLYTPLPDTVFVTVPREAPGQPPSFRTLAVGAEQIESLSVELQLSSSPWERSLARYIKEQLLPAIAKKLKSRSKRRRQLDEPPFQLQVHAGGRRSSRTGAVRVTYNEDAAYEGMDD